MVNSELASIRNVINGVSILVTAAVIVWLCSSAVSHGVDISVLKSQYTTISQSLCEIKKDSKENRQLLLEIKGKLLP